MTFVQSKHLKNPHTPTTPSLPRGKTEAHRLSCGVLIRYYDFKVGSGQEAVPGERVAIHFDCRWRGITFMTSRQGMGVTGGTPFGFDLGTREGTAGSTLKGLDLVWYHRSQLSLLWKTIEGNSEYHWTSLMPFTIAHCNLWPVAAGCERDACWWS